ncbi:T9SS type A sorting domain-containing protein [Flavobacterium sp. Sd200]|uniref:hemoblobin-interacting domain-containing protein n=1 Tax=Flavobacterium sp. Sd200 TaxID=2692211 RepID=UPI00136DCCED|nr:T9SS type A sorting domain-containing protein [Flavobacterium sp. Sd200]MXN90741.1 T9SS type A sorting domain-containing protein [Flavobacterium sp. Sd200]
MKKITSIFSEFSNSAKNVSLLILLLAGYSGHAQVALPHYDGLDYTVGESLPAQTAGGWILNQSSSSDMLITEGSLSYSGLAASTGNKVAFSGGGEDAIKTFTQTTSGTVYYSYILNVTDVSSATGYFAGLLPNSVATVSAAPGSGSIAATVWVKPSANTGFFNIGFSARANQTTVGTSATNLQYSSTDLPLNTPVLIVVSYQMVSGSGNDVCNLWVNPVPGIAEPTYTFTATPTTDIADVSGFFIKQNGNSSTPGVEMDELRFGLTWDDVTPAAPAGVVTPTLVADITDNNVDNDIDITFTDDAVWRAAVTEVKIGAEVLTSGTDYDLTEGSLKLKPSGLNILLTVSGSKEVTVVAAGYDDAVLTQQINAGAPNSNSSVSISAPLALGATSTVTCVARDQYNNLVSGYTFKYFIIVVNVGLITIESYLIDGTAQTANANNIAVTALTDENGIATFTVTLPEVMDGGDGIILQPQLNDGVTNISAAFIYFQLSSQTITFNALAPVTYGAPDFSLEATASSLLPVTYTSSDPLVATVDANGLVTIVGVGTTTITASQGGNLLFSPAVSVSQDLVVNCAASGAVISGSTTLCSGEGANLQIAISALQEQAYTVVYSDGTENHTVTNYTSGTVIPVTPTATTTYSLVSVVGSNPNICEAIHAGSAIVTVNVTPAPTGISPQVFTTNDPVFINNIDVTGTEVIWYASLENALAGTGALDPFSEVITENTYYAMQTVDGCRSLEPLAVTVQVVLSKDKYAMSNLKYYPNPVAGVLNISYSEIITKVEVFNSLGQQVVVMQPNALNPVIDLSKLPSANYYAVVESNGTKKIIQLVKM